MSEDKTVKFDYSYTVVKVSYDGGNDIEIHTEDANGHFSSAMLDVRTSLGIVLKDYIENPKRILAP